MDKPILFNTEMVRAILDGRKTQTRLVIKPQPVFESGYDTPHENELGIFWKSEESYPSIEAFIKDCPYQPGDRLWVRETWNETTHGYNYKASPLGNCRDSYPWRPSIHMPREAARLFLTVKDVRVERLQEISEEDARAEGVREFTLQASNGVTKLYGLTPEQPEMGLSARDEFKELWNSIYAKRGQGWEVNPWLWAYTFEREG